MPAQRPQLGIVVLAFGAPEQTKNTLYSLSPAHQRNVAEADYRVVVVERAGDAALGAEAITALGGGFSYVQVAADASPWALASAGLAALDTPVVGILFDGANLVTPRLLEHALLGARAFERALVAVPAYQLGKTQHHLSQAPLEDELAERALLDASGWKEDGHVLFELCCADPSFDHGYLSPFIEVGCLFASRECLDAIGEPASEPKTAGELAVFAYGGLSQLDAARLVVLASEGTFHQRHDCRSTAEGPDRRQKSRELRQRLLRSLPPPREPVLLGAFSGHAFGALLRASDGATMYHAVRAELGKPDYPPQLAR